MTFRLECHTYGQTDWLANYLALYFQPSKLKLGILTNMLLTLNRRGGAKKAD